MRDIALLTGANGQIGKLLLKNLVKKKYYVICLDNKYSKLKILKNCIKYKLDISNENDVKVFFEFLSKNKITRINTLINNAAIQNFESIENESFEDFMNVLKVNVGGSFLFIKHSINLLKKSKNANILNIASIYGLLSGDPKIYTDTKRNTSDAYAASKAALIQLSKYYAVHLAKYSIRVNSISPGGIYNKQGKDFIYNYSKKTPLSRMANVEEIVNSILFIISNDASYINGHNFIVDGGFSSW